MVTSLKKVLENLIVKILENIKEVSSVMKINRSLQIYIYLVKTEKVWYYGYFPDKTGGRMISPDSPHCSLLVRMAFCSLTSRYHNRPLGMGRSGEISSSFSRILIRFNLLLEHMNILIYEETVIIHTYIHTCFCVWFIYFIYNFLP